MKIEIVGDIVLANDFWDCECTKNYIHRKSVMEYCEKCLTFCHEQPSSRLDEVIFLKPEILTLKERKEIMEFYKQHFRL